MLTKLLEEINERNWNTKSIVVVSGEEIIAEHYNVPKSDLLPQYSISKAFTATAIGLLCDEGKLNLQDLVSDYIPEVKNSDNTKLKNVKIKHLLMNASGCAEGYLFEADRHNHNTDDYLSYIIQQPLQYEAGEIFVYSNSNYYLLSRIAENITGTPLDEFIIERIFKPFGITEYMVTRCPMNHTLGGSGLFLMTTDMIKLGILYSNLGTYKGIRIISEDYVNKAISIQIKLNSKEGYGFGFMMKDTRCVYVAGNFNQLLLIDKFKHMIVGINSDVRPSLAGTLMKLVRRTIIKDN